MGRLNESDARILDQKAHREPKKAADWYMIAIEDGDEFTRRLLECRVDVPRLGVPIVRSGDVLDPELGRDRLHLGATAIIQQVDPHPGPFHGARAQDRPP